MIELKKKFSNEILLLSLFFHQRHVHDKELKTKQKNSFFCKTPYSVSIASTLSLCIAKLEVFYSRRSLYMSLIEPCAQQANIAW